jgi:hypothetical protein
MPRREDEQRRSAEQEIRYCVVCRRHLGSRDWAVHAHNPDRGKRRSIEERLRRFLGR